MTQLKNKAYGPPATLVYAEPQYDIRVVWGPRTWDFFHRVTVRGVEVYQLGETIVDSRDICYRRCAFPDGRIMLVNEGNIRIQKVKFNGHAIK